MLELTEWTIENLEDVVSILTGYDDNLLPMYIGCFVIRNVAKLISLK